MTARPLERRTVLIGAATTAALVGVAPAGCGAGSATTDPSSPPGATAATGSTQGGPAAGRRPTRADWRALAQSIDGDVVRRHDEDYDEVSRLFDPRFDHVRPLAVVEATSADDVREAVRFGRRFDLRCRPRSGGHSYVGASTVSDGLVIDTGRMQDVGFDAATGSARVGAGAGLYAVHAALARHDRTIPTGTCPTVGAAGLTLGGGLGVDSRKHGLTCDRLVSLTMVTADGSIRHVDETQHADLLWAARGGGGGNVGIVTSLRFDTSTARRTGFFLMSFPWSHAPAVLRGWGTRVAVMPRSSWANLHLEAGADGSTEIRVVGTCRAGRQTAEAEAMEAAVGVEATSVSTFEKSFLDGVAFLGGGTTSAREVFAAGSDIVPAMTPALSRSLPRIVAARAARHRSAAVILDPLTGAVQDRGVGDTAFPWRRHLCDIQWYVGLPSSASRSAVRAAYRWIDTAHRGIHRHSAGGYVNYLEPGRAVRDYYGPNYQRLRAIKHAVDPDGFFTSPYTVG